MIFAGGTGWFVLLVALLGFFLFAVRAVLQAWLLDLTPPGMGGSAIGMLFGTQAIGQALGPVCAGIVADHFGLMAAFYFLAGTIVIANLLVFVTPSNLREEPQRGASLKQASLFDDGDTEISPPSPGGEAKGGLRPPSLVRTPMRSIGYGAKRGGLG